MKSTLKELFIDELRDLYDCEQQLIKALPRMVKAANSHELRKGFEHHLGQTKEHASRLQQTLELLGEAKQKADCSSS